MNINLDNYETFFLMYVDKELSPAARELVEVFVAQYPYLHQELQLLQDTVLTIDKENMFMDKTSLYKTPVGEESMLLHLDNELFGEAKEQLLSAIQQDKMLKKEWDLLQQTKLDPNEQYTFLNKAILYRKERKPVISLLYLRWAAAAVLIAAGFFIGIRFANTTRSTQLVLQPANTDTLSSANGGKLKANSIVSTLIPTNNIQSSNSVEMREASSNSEQQSRQNVNQVKSTPKVERAVGNNIPPTHSDNGSIQHVAKINPATNTDNNIIAPTTTKREALLANQTGNGLDPIKAPIGQNAFTANIDKGDLGKGDARLEMASLNSNSEENNNRLFILDEEDVNRSKAGTFFKRLKRTVARTARVKPGNSLKIAGFEFAVK